MYQVAQKNTKKDVEIILWLADYEICIAMLRRSVFGVMQFRMEGLLRN
jgi:hypothetical protein